MKLTPETIDAALDDAWGAPWRECVHIGPSDDPDSFAFKLTCIDEMKCEACDELWQDEDMRKSQALDGWVCPECIEYPEYW